MIPLVVFAAAAVAITWPLAAHLDTHVVLANMSALGDPWVVGGSLAAASRALVGLPPGGIYHPTPLSFLYGETGIGAFPLFVGPFLLTGNPVLALNLVFLGGLTLTGWSLHAVVQRWTDSRTAGLLAGITFVASPFAAWSWGPSAANYVTLWYAPWIVFLTATPLATWRAAAAVSGLLFVQGLSTPYVALGVAGPTAALGAARIVRAATRSSGARLLVAVGGALIGWTLAFWPYLAVRLREPDLARQSLYPYLPLFPHPANPFAAGEPSGVAPAALAAIAIGAVIALRGTNRRRAWIVAAEWTLIGLVLALPPRIALEGRTIVTPTGWLVDAGLPVHALRDDGRRGLAASIGLSLLVGLAWAEIAATLRRRGGPFATHATAAALAVGIVAGLARTPVRHGTAAATPGRYPLFDAATAARVDSPIMAALRQGGGPLLEIPTAPGPIHHAVAMHRAAIHGRPLLNGLQGYWPREFPARMALACRLPDPAALAALRHETGVELLLVHLVPVSIGRPVGPYACPPRPMGPPADAEDAPWNPAVWEALARDGREDLELVLRDGSDLLFRVKDRR